MMCKRNSIEILSYLIGVCMLLASCNYAAEPPVGPDGNGSNNPGAGNSVASIAYLKSLYSGHPLIIRQDISISGMVVSNDKHGNYYKTLAITDETGGIEFRLDMEDIYTVYRPGDIIDINCNSLTLGAYGGMVQLGGVGTDGYEVGYLEEKAVASHMRVKGMNPSAPVAEKLSIDGLSKRYLSCLVQLDEVQFREETMGLGWSERDRDTDRMIEDRRGNVLVVRTSRYAVFASYVLPRGSGHITGILSWFNDHYQLRVVDYRTLSMYGPRF